jgi:chaperonin GroEL
VDALKIEGDEAIGAKIIRRALEEPLRLIAGNAGHEGSVVVNKVRENKSYNYGFDAQAEVYGDMLEAGIIDPTKVVRIALENASSVGALFLMTDAAVSEKKEKEKAPAMPGGGMGGMGGMDY